MNVSVLGKPQAIKISSKRQITIPARMFEQGGFKDYALCTWTDKGMFLQPLDVDDEDETVGMLRRLIAEGYEGEDLIAAYQGQRRTAWMRERLDEAERDVAEGRVDSYENMRARIRGRYGL